MGSHMTVRQECGQSHGVKDWLRTLHWFMGLGSTERDTLDSLLDSLLIYKLMFCTCTCKEITKVFKQLVSMPRLPDRMAQHSLSYDVWLTGVQLLWGGQVFGDPVQ